MTVSEAVLGLAAAILCRFGVGSIELEVMDDGSGRLAQWYANAGFSNIQRMVWQWERPRKGLWMAAPAGPVAQQLAPRSWCQALLPEEFDAMEWMNGEVLKFWLERACIGRLPRWSWSVPWPHRAVLHMEVMPSTNSKKSGEALMLEANLMGACVVLRIPTELVYC